MPQPPDREPKLALNNDDVFIKLIQQVNKWVSDNPRTKAPEKVENATRNYLYAIDWVVPDIEERNRRRWADERDRAIQQQEEKEKAWRELQERIRKMNAQDTVQFERDDFFRFLSLSQYRFQSTRPAFQEDNKRWDEQERTLNISRGLEPPRRNKWGRWKNLSRTQLNPAIKRAVRRNSNREPVPKERLFDNDE